MLGWLFFVNPQRDRCRSGHGTKEKTTGLEGREPEKERKEDCQTKAEDHSLYSPGNRGGCPGSHASADGLRLSVSPGFFSQK